MPYDDDNDRSTLSTTSTSVYTPVTIDKQPLTWDGNDASILGILYEIGRYFKARGLFQTLLKYRAVAVGTKLAMEDTNTGSSNAVAPTMAARPHPRLKRA